MSRIALLGGGVRVRVWIREQRKVNPGHLSMLEVSAAQLIAISKTGSLLHV